MVTLNLNNIPVYFRKVSYELTKDRKLEMKHIEITNSKRLE